MQNTPEMEVIDQLMDILARGKLDADSRLLVGQSLKTAAAALNAKTSLTHQLVTAVRNIWPRTATAIAIIGGIASIIALAQ